QVISSKRKPDGRLLVPWMAPGTTSSDECLPCEKTLPSKEVEAPNLNQFQWPAFHLIEQPIGGTNATGGSLPAVRALRTSRMTCCRTPFASFESSSLPRYRTFRPVSKTKKSGVATRSEEHTSELQS